MPFSSPLRRFFQVEVLSSSGASPTPVLLVTWSDAVLGMGFHQFRDCGVFFSLDVVLRGLVCRRGGLDWMDCLGGKFKVESCLEGFMDHEKNFVFPWKWIGTLECRSYILGHIL